MIETKTLIIRIFIAKLHWHLSIEIFIINSVLKTHPLTYKIKDLNGENIIGSFYEKELMLSKS